jgi:5-methylcytosine-specific restriction protein A
VDVNTLSPHRRREFPASVKLAAWNRCKVNGVPHCERCRLRLVGRPIYDHDLPDGLQGEPTLENCVVSCTACDRLKTYGRDIPMMAKADRIAKKNAGMKRKYPWPKRTLGRKAG